MKKKILIISIITMVVLSSLLFIKKEEKELKENKEISINTNNIISYTIDGEIAQEKPTKEQGYKANKIKCDKESIISWDNDNWEVEIIESKGQDRCMVDFTKEESTPGYKVSITTNSSSSLDSLSKTAVENGKVIIYSKDTIANINGCSGEIKGNKVIINNITQNQTCNIQIKQTLADTIKTAYAPVSGRTNFSSIDNGTPKLYT
ncbi:MAG: hypothetical protein HFI16_15020, partial [Lachnospiraceae bacterium]|nr:hypothetical protein [Lachnospiraceae bacterium]